MEIESKKIDQIGSSGVDVLANRKATLEQMAFMKVFMESIESVKEGIAKVQLDCANKTAFKDSGDLLSSSVQEKTPKSKNVDQILLESFIANLNVTNKLDDLTESVIKAQIDKVIRQVGELQKTVIDIKAFQDQLADLPSIDQLNELKNSLSSIESQYKNIIGNDKDNKISGLINQVANLGLGFPEFKGSFDALVNSMNHKDPAAFKAVLNVINTTAIIVSEMQFKLQSVQEVQRALLNQVVSSGQDVKKSLESALKTSFEEFSEQELVDLLIKVISSDTEKKEVKEDEDKTNEIRLLKNQLQLNRFQKIGV